MDANELKKICALANIEIPPEKIGKFQSELELITGYVKMLDELDLTGVEPTVYGQEPAEIFREDIVKTWWQNPESALLNAPETIGAEFKVQKIVE